MDDFNGRKPSGGILNGIGSVAGGILKAFAGLGRAIIRIWSEGTTAVRVVLSLVPVVLALMLVLSGKIVFSSDGKTTNLGLKNIGELATQVGYYTNVEVIEGVRELWGWSVPLTHSKYIFSYDGIIKAGIDFAEVEVQVNERTKTIRVSMPDIIVLSNEIGKDSLKIYDESTSIFTPLTLDAVNAAQEDLKAEAEETAIGNGLFENARVNAETLMKGFLAGMYDLTQYTVEFE